MIRSKKIIFGMTLVIAVLFMPFILSYTDSNFAYRSGGFASQAYLGGQNINLYGGQGTEICSSGKDFVVQIAPLGCTPSVVRSDLLEEQNVAVFCPLIASQINPLIKVDRINSVSFSGRNYSDQISGIGFHPTRAALGFTSASPIGRPIANDIGYVVIVLKQNPKEATMPEFVTGDLVANIKYKMSDIGVGSITRDIPEMDDTEWGENFNKYGFWGDKGYIRVEGIGDNSATVAVYTGGGNSDKIRSFNLAKGDSSSEIYVPGFFCQAGAVLTLEDLVNPETRALFSISGEIVELKQGEKFLENKCTIKKLTSQGLVQNIIARCQGDDGAVNFELLRSPSVKINVDGEDKNVMVGERINDKEGPGIYLAGVKYKGDSTKQEDLQISIFDSPSTLKKLPKITEDNRKAEKIVEYNTETTWFGSNIKLVGFSAGKNQDFSTLKSNVNFQKYFSGAMDDYDNILGNFGGEKISQIDDVEATYGYQALVDSIGLAFGTAQNEEAILLCQKFAELYPDKNIAACGNPEDYSNQGISSYGLKVNGRFKEISFMGIIEPTYSEYGVKLNIGGNPVELSKGEKKSIGVGEYVQMVSLTDKSVNLNIRINVSDKNKLVEDNVDLKIDDVQNFGSNYNFGITNINLEKVAKISLTPNIKVDGTSTNFSFQIGIEKRAIQLSPEKTEARIKKLNDTIVKWTELSENLATVVKGLKGACLATGAVLTVTNLFTGMGGTAIARADVNSYWKDECEDKEYEGETYNSVDHCFLENSDAIQEAVKARATEIKEINKNPITDKTRDTRYPEIINGLKGKKFRDSSGEMTDVSDEFIASALKKDVNGYLLSDREMRDLEMELSILEKDKDNVIAQNNFNRYMGDFYVRGSQNAKIENLANRVGVNSGSAGILGEVTKIGVSETTPIGNVKGLTQDEGDFGKYVYAASLANGKEYAISYDDNEVIRGIYDVDDSGIFTFIDPKTDMPKELKGVVFTKYDASSYKNKYKDPELTYFETAPFKGFPALVPIDKKNGWYAAMKQRNGAAGGVPSYQDSGALSSFSLCNVGPNGREEFYSGHGDDECRVFNPGTGNIYGTFPGLDKNKTGSLVRCAMNGVEQAEGAYKSGVTSVSISSCSGGSEKFRVGNPAVNLPAIQCQDFMSPKNCLLLFNVCDPVICPSSRCDFGGTYPVDNVVQSGIIGSIALCLPNYKEKIMIPICLTGIQAGIDGLISVFTNYRDCLEHNLETGEMTGVCDEIHSIYLCEFFWRQAIPLMKMGIPKVLSALMGEGGRGGGEYATVQKAWDNANAGVGYMTNYYGANAFAAFKAQSTEEVGTSVCKSFASVNYPNSGGGFLDALLEPESPSQFHAWFSEVPFTTATVPATSQYKVFYHVFAGKDQGAYYNVYLSNPTGGSYFQSTGRLVVASGYIDRGDYASETRDLTATAGFKQLCISVNGKEDCGFKQVSTSFAVNYVNDQFIKQQTTQENIDSEKECVGGTSSAYSLLQPNIQEGADDVINPQLYNQGIVRVCSTSNPGQGTDTSWNNANESRWRQVGICDDQNMGCWIDTKSVKDVVKSTSIENAIIGDVTSEYMKMLETGEYLDRDEDEFKSMIQGLTDKQKTEPAEVIAEIDSSMLAKVLLNNNKVKLISIRAGAFKFLAVEFFNKVVAEKKKAEEKSCEVLGGDLVDITYGCEGREEIKGTSDTGEWFVCCKEKEIEKKSCENLGGVPRDIRCDTGFTDISSLATDLGEGYVCCKKKVVEGIGQISIAGEIFTEAQVRKAILETNLVNDQCSNYVKLTMLYSKKYEVDPLLVFALMEQESGCNNELTSGVGAKGLMQIYSFEMCEDIGTEAQIKNNIDKNIECGISILSKKYKSGKCETETKNYDCDAFTFGNDTDEGYKGKTEPAINKMYAEWACALRNYNGWACARRKGTGDYVYAKHYFVEEVFEKYKGLVKIADPFIDLSDGISSSGGADSSEEWTTLLEGNALDFNYPDKEGYTNSRIWVPGSITRGSYPLVIFLHGCDTEDGVMPENWHFKGRGENDVIKITSKLILNGDSDPVILAAPSQIKSILVDNRCSDNLWRDFDYVEFKNKVELELHTKSITINSVSVVGHSGAGCFANQGIFEAIEKLDVKYAGFFDTCDFGSARMLDIPKEERVVVSSFYESLGYLEEAKIAPDHDSAIDVGMEELLGKISF